MLVPTVYPVTHFDPESDAADLRKAMKGLGTSEGVIINILSNRSSHQRQEILHKYNKERDLIKDFKKDLKGKFEDIVLALMTPWDEYLANELHRAMAGAGTDESVLIEVLCSRDNESIKEVKAAYKKLYGTELEKAIKYETCKDFEELLVALCSCDRKEGPAEVDIAPILAKNLYRAGEGRKGTDEDEIRRILTTYSYNTLRLVFQIYRKESGNTLGEVMEKELEGNFKQGMLAVYNCINSTPAFFAEALHKSLAGMGTHDQTLTRLVVSRCEIDLENIKQEYDTIYNKPLAKDVKSDTTGDFEKMLLALIK